MRAVKTVVNSTSIMNAQGAARTRPFFKAMTLRRLNPFSSSRSTDSDRTIIQGSRQFTDLVNSSPTQGRSSSASAQYYNGAILQIGSSAERSPSILSIQSSGMLQSPIDSVWALSDNGTNTSLIDSNPLSQTTESSIIDPSRTTDTSEQASPVAPRYRTTIFRK